MSTIFDRRDDESPFFSFVAREFHRIGSDRRRFLLDKENVGAYVEQLGFKAPLRRKIVKDIDRLQVQDIGDSAVLKYGAGWSNQGVMLLEHREQDRYFDFLSLSEISLADIIEKQKAVDQRIGHANRFWIIEEFLQPIHSVGRIPFDYKFYTFQGRVAIVLQIDRNSNPPKMAIFDANFFPLKISVDFEFGLPETQLGIPLVPLHANEMLDMAEKLSRITGSPFVSVDLYDTLAGPAFGEFTFSPGGVHKRLIRYSQELIDLFDSYFSTALESADEDIAIHELACRMQTRRPAFHALDTHTYQVWSAYAYNSGSRGALRLTDFFWEQEKAAETEEQKQHFRFLKNAWASVRAYIADR